MILHIPESFRTGASPSDAVWSHTKDTRHEEGSYSTAEVQSKYSTARADWREKSFEDKNGFQKLKENAFERVYIYKYACIHTVLFVYTYVGMKSFLISFLTFPAPLKSCPSSRYAVVLLSLWPGLRTACKEKKKKEKKKKENPASRRRLHTITSPPFAVSEWMCIIPGTSHGHQHLRTPDQGFHTPDIIHVHIVTPSTTGKKKEHILKIA